MHPQNVQRAAIAMVFLSFAGGAVSALLLALLVAHEWLPGRG